jgi:hypothetical protein
MIPGERNHCGGQPRRGLSLQIWSSSRRHKFFDHLESVRTRRLIRSRQSLASRARRRLAMQTLLSVEQLSACLHKSVASIRSDASRNPQSLPPICRLPGTKRLLWRAEDVEGWLEKHVLSPIVEVAPPVRSGPPRRGRPRKSEQAQNVPAQMAPKGAQQARRGGGRG